MRGLPPALQTFTQAEMAAVVAQLLLAGGVLDYNTMADVTGERSAAAFQFRYRRVTQDAKLVKEAREKGDKGLVTELSKNYENNNDDTNGSKDAKTTRKKTKRTASAEASAEGPATKKKKNSGNSANA